MIVWKSNVDVLKMLKDAGFSSKRIQVENLIGQASVQQIRVGKMVGIKTLDKICDMLNVQPSELIEFKLRRQSDF